MRLQPFSSLLAAARSYLRGEVDAGSDQPWHDPFYDDAVGPMMVGGLYIFAGRTNVGKSMSVLRQLLLMAEAGTKCAYVSCEDPAREVGRRVAAAPHTSEAKDRVTLYIPARPRLSEVLGFMQKTDARVIGLDYAQVVIDDTGVSTFDRAGQMRNVVSELKAAARTRGQSVLLAAQLRRPPNQGGSDDEAFGDGPRPEPRGTIYDIRDSSDLENQAEAVILLHKLGRAAMDTTVAKCKSRMGGERRKLYRGQGGWLYENQSDAA